MNETRATRRIGIDLGTTNTVLGLGGAALELGEHGTLLPSVVAFLPSGTLAIGASARRRRPIDAVNTIFSAKRIIGSTSGSRSAKDFARRYPMFDLNEKNGLTAFKTRAGLFTATEIGKLILSEGIEQIGGKPEKLTATVAVPTRFDDAQRKATVVAVRLTGIPTVRVVDEPTAVIAAYAARAPTGTAAVYDLGGGTFDFALFDTSSGLPRCLAADGDPSVGGDDIDRLVADWGAQRILEQYRVDVRSDPAVYDRFVAQCEQAKIQLPDTDEATIDLAQIDPMAVAGSSIVLTRALLSGLTMQLLQRTFVVVDEVLRRSNKKPDEVDNIFMAGGTTLLPMVWEGVRQFFGRNPRCDYPPMNVVAAGASLGTDDGTSTA